ncbi:protein kinase, putative [Trypanosoma brucei gambiense DAL972]|uniref:non-specific serine/threonine protein kinase n=1 Tax=Trypanosoma brucei gambiense (strain MHOM/CI/86/DAL972) TaxID=679716 RepID=D0A5L6_TRYB9|nr:protein kinase, putative [Trypanosoma brucei gambiense DAL972]CBH16967.1 protein kinase, putative [Trypanosoma brucei gambiense DAL972]|eukprot:XP_011779231.1 protein kinase, putative [Trypanosoma brucei gambiense DAL972]
MPLNSSHRERVSVGGLTPCIKKATVTAPETAFTSHGGGHRVLDVAASGSEGLHPDSGEGQRLHPMSDFGSLYKVRRQLGSGGYSVVFEVVDCITHERKAAKFVVGKVERRAARARLTGPLELRLHGDGRNGDRRKVSSIGGLEKARSANSRPTVSDSLVKEVAMGLMAQHANLVHTSDVFVHDTEDLRRRLREYAPQLSLETVRRSEGAGPYDVARGAACGESPSKSWQPHRLRQRSGGSGSDTTASVRGGDAPILHECNTSSADQITQGVETAKRYLQESRVQCILVMELLTGNDLFTLVSRGPLNERMAASYMFDLFLALRYLHNRNIVHRDVKVENMALDSENRVRLIDYGFCEVLRRSGDANPNGVEGKNPEGLLTQFCGSHHYVAPEVITSAWLTRHGSKNSETTTHSGVSLPPIAQLSATGAPPPKESVEGCVVGRQNVGSAGALRTHLTRRGVGYGLSADIWSAGIVMFVLLHSAFPYHDERRSRLLKMIVSNKRSLGSASRLSSDARDLLRKLLTHDASRRPPVNEVLEHCWFRKQLGEKVGGKLSLVA